MKHKKVIVVAGPTSSGKTALSIELAKKFVGEVISADSRQVYQGLNLGTGKVTKEEMGLVPHHLLDVVAPMNVFTASDFVGLGRRAIADIHTRMHIPIIAGGTGFYIDALVGRISPAEVPPNEQLREELEKMSLEKLQALLKSKDLARFNGIDINNKQRLVRAIEIAQILGKNPPMKSKEIYDVLWIGLDVPMETLRNKIEMRVYERLGAGMLEEAKALYQEGLMYERMEALGLEYRFMARHLQGLLTQEEMISELHKEIYAYAKRQMTWFKKNKNIQWYSPLDLPSITETVKQFIQK